MYYYISFLRPPPQQVSPEQYPDAHDIYYSWSLVSNSRDDGSNMQLPPMTRPVKLTTWRESNAYRELKIPCPQGVREGQQYRLVLSAYQQGSPHVVDLTAKALNPLAVSSMPITFSSRNRPNASKQERIERVYCLSTGSASHAFLKVIEQTSFDLDKKVWDSGLGLSSWLSDLVSLAERPHSEQAVFAGEVRSTILGTRCNIIELGAGTGIVSLAMGAIRSEVAGVEASGRIITTDLQSAMPLLEHNVATNAHIFSCSGTTPQPVVLDWDEQRLPAEAEDVASDLDMIVMADVAYNTASFASLIRTVDQILRLSDLTEKHRAPIVLLGYKERDTAERDLWAMTRNIGVEFYKLGEKPGAGGVPVEIWAGKRSIVCTVPAP